MLLPPWHTREVLDGMRAALSCYSTILQADPIKDPLTVRCVPNYQRVRVCMLQLWTTIGSLYAVHSVAICMAHPVHC
jgi:hypothetical protein